MEEIIRRYQIATGMRIAENNVDPVQPLFALIQKDLIYQLITVLYTCKLGANAWRVKKNKKRNPQSSTESPTLHC
jgi:hypothetical protein